MKRLLWCCGVTLESKVRDERKACILHSVGTVIEV